ncbi:hypothetical protein E2F50_02940 [Rhizobium deserti]|uniref:Uncharacterized protein n=1 Tax=Rhizobium deserti TaxID=2547961 RepID=A0A4R5UML1_9HYPH|nr:hypothetical protein [Rhizobium deserti]TDK39106.1 hypothetical protein E2F50_02940 [Rhizobium deserti]
MSNNDSNADPEQRIPPDVTERADEQKRSDRQSLAPAAVQPSQTKDESERPVVDPVTGGVI